ncbi:hypothetical protein CCL24_18650 [Pseudomonas congelans]|nr:hypothetical protein CCL24_18650 [Pseudomonas congelans]
MIGRRASRTACDAERRTIVEVLLLVLAAGRRSELVRDLPGTGSKTDVYGTSGAAGPFSSRL